jgi:hypothetical protein
LTYGFPLRTKEFETIGIAMHPIMAGVGHSCDPNSIIILGPHLKLGGSHNLEIVPLQKIARAEQITISYIDSSAPLSLRKAELKTVYFINCSCPKCSNETVAAEAQQISDQSSTLERVSTLIWDTEKDTTLHMPITRLRHALYLLLECSWPTDRYPFPLILRQLIKAYIKDEQWNLAFAFACALRRSNKRVYPRRDNRLHPFRMADDYVLIVLMTKIIQTDNWRAQKLDLTDRGLNLVGLRAYLFSRLQDDQRLVQSWKFGSTYHFAMILRVDQTQFQELVRDKEKRKKSKEGLNKLADEILERARRW